MKVILTLNHGQASVQCGFGINKSALKVNITKESVVSKKLIRAHMIANKLEPDTVPISNQLIWSASCARQSYKESMLAADTAKENNRISNEKWILLEEINAVSSKCVDLQNTSKALDGEFIVCIKTAEKEIDMNLVIKGNMLKSRSEEAQAEPKKLQEALGILEKTKKKKKWKKWLLSNHTSWGLSLVFRKQNWYCFNNYRNIYMWTNFSYSLVIATSLSVLLDLSNVSSFIGIQHEVKYCCY